MPKRTKPPVASRRRGPVVEEIPLSPVRQAQAMAQSRPRLPLTKQVILQELAIVGLSDITHYAIDALGNVALTEGAPQWAMRAVSSIKKRIHYDKEGNATISTELTLWGKLGALRMAAQHLGMLTEKVEHSGAVELVHKLDALGKMPDHELQAYAKHLREQKLLSDGRSHES